MRSSTDIQPARVQTSNRAFTGFVVAGLLALLLAWTVRAWDGLTEADREVRARWSQLEASYRHRLELVPPLVELVEGEVDVQPMAEARAELVRIEGTDFNRALDEPELFARMNVAQDALAGAVGTALAAAPVEQQTPELGVLRHQLEALDARIGVEQQRFNEAARHFNAERLRFPALFIARASERFAEKPFVQ